MPAEPQPPPAPFVVGVARSGTTLLRLMLDAHPDLAIPPHTAFVPVAAERCAVAADPRAAFIATATSHLHWPDYHVDAQALRERVEAIEPFDVGEGLRAFYGLYRERFGKPRWGDKTPSHMLHMTLIQRLLPEARFVHLIRDGRAVALSAARERRVSGRKVSFRRLAERWAQRIEAARDQARALAWYLEVRYEDLVTDTEATLRRICAFADLGWDERMLEYHRTSRERISELVTVNLHNARSLEQRRARHVWTRQPPDPARARRWERELSEAERREYELAAGDLLEQLGYLERPQTGARG